MPRYRTPKLHNPKTVAEYQKLTARLNKKYRGEDYSNREGILLGINLMNDICFSLIELQNRIDAIEAEND